LVAATNGNFFPKKYENLFYSSVVYHWQYESTKLTINLLLYSKELCFVSVQTFKKGTLEKNIFLNLLYELNHSPFNS